MRATRVRATSGSIALETLHASAIRIPTDDPQADGTLEWDATTLVVAESTGGGERGLGYSYGDAAAAFVIRNALAPAVEGLDPMNLPAASVDQGIPRVKMKVGRAVDEDARRVIETRRAIGSETEPYVDANGAYGRKPALEAADLFAEAGVTWFEEPVSSHDLEGLRILGDRARAVAGVSAGAAVGGAITARLLERIR